MTGVLMTRNLNATYRSIGLNHASFNFYCGSRFCIAVILNQNRSGKDSHETKNFRWHRIFGRSKKGWKKGGKSLFGNVTPDGNATPGKKSRRNLLLLLYYLTDNGRQVYITFQQR